VTSQRPANPPRTRQGKGQTAATSSTSSSRQKAPTSLEGLQRPRGNPHNWPIVEILWIDAVAGGLSEWLDVEEIHAMKPVDSKVVGYLVSQTPTQVTVASLINDGSAAHALCIPTEIVIEMTYWERKQ